MKSQKKRLGRGLDSLLSSTRLEQLESATERATVGLPEKAESAARAGAPVSEIKIARIQRNPHQPRQRWDEEQLPEELRPQIAIDSFITSYKNSIEVIHRGYQMFIRKRKDPCNRFTIPPIGCSPVGQYIYVWNWNGKNELYPRDMSKPITLSDKERNLIENLIKTTRFGENTLFLDNEVTKDKDFANLSERLKLDFTNIEVEW